VGVRAAALSTALLLAALPLAAQERPVPVKIGPAMLEIVDRAEAGHELRHDDRVLAKEYRIEPGPVVASGDAHVAVFDMWGGGNACVAWPLVVLVDAAGKVALDRRFETECTGFAYASQTDAIVLVRRAFPFEDGAVWQAAGNGVRFLGTLKFAPQPNSTWADLDKALDHPLSLFDVAPLDAAVRKLTGSSYAEFARALGVASPVEARGPYLIGSGCLPHACGDTEGFLAIEREAKRIFLGLKTRGRVRAWPALAAWPKPLRDEFGAWRKQ
jgi:hypothetical protein